MNICVERSLVKGDKTVQKNETNFTIEKKDLNALYCIYNVMASVGPVLN